MNNFKQRLEFFMKTYEKECKNVVFKNDLISLVWKETRLDVLDSDNNYIEYYFIIL